MSSGPFSLNHSYRIIQIKFIICFFLFFKVVYYLPAKLWIPVKVNELLRPVRYLSGRIVQLIHALRPGGRDAGPALWLFQELYDQKKVLIILVSSW